MLDNVNPHNLSAEQQILGAIMLDNKIIRRLNLSIDDFYTQKHKQIYKAMLEFDLDGMPIDYATLKTKVVEEDIIYLSQYCDAPTTANAIYHSDMVKEMSNKRKLKNICLHTINEIDNETIDSLLGNIRNNMAQLVKGRGCNLASSSEIGKELLEFLERREKNKNELSGIPSGFKDLDNLTDGFQCGDLIVLAARPSQGKSALAMAFAENAGVPVGIISIEMGPHQLGIRSIAKLSGIELWKLRKGILAKHQWPALHGALSDFAQMPLYFSFNSKSTIEIERTITQMIEIYDCKMAIVDYLQLTKSKENKKREQEVAEVSRLLKIMAQSNNIPIIALSQLNREVEKRENKRPILSDLRESGAIEQDADVVMFLYRENTESDGIVEINIAKGRNIGLGTIKLAFTGDTMTFGDYIREVHN